MLAFVHDGVAAATKTPEMALDAQEAGALGMATANVLNELDVRPNPLHTAIFGLVTTGAAIYGPRVALIRMRKADERKPREGAPFTVVQ